jgi:hypothetical protein
MMQGKEIIEHFINELEKQGITSMPVWTDAMSPTPSLVEEGNTSTHR